MFPTPTMLYPDGKMTPAVRDANTWKVFMGITEDDESYRFLADYANAPADEAWVYSCIKRLYTAAQSVPLRVYQYQSDGLDLEPVIGTDNSAGLALQRLLDWVNPIDMNGSDLKAYTMASWALWGGCYWAKVRGQYGGPPQELYWLSAADIEPNAPDGRRILSYIYRPRQAVPVEYSPRDIVAFRDVNLADPLRPLSPLQSARNDMAVQRSAAQHTASTLKNWGVPPGVFVVPKGEEITTQDRGLIQKTLRALRGPKNAGKTAILPGGLQWQSLAMASKDAEWIQARRISRMTVCAVLGVPLVLAGDDEKLTTYASLPDARRIFWQDTVVPRLNWIADAINGWLVPDFDPSGRTKVAFDFTDVVALREPDSVEKTIALSEIQNQVRVPNEYRSRFRIGKPLPDGERVTPKTNITIRPALENMPPADMQSLFPALNPLDKVAKRPSTPELFQIGGAEGDYFDLPADLRTPETVPQDVAPPTVLRSYGRRLYRQTPVKSFVEFGGPLDVAALGLPESVRAAVEDGLRRRYSADQIAKTLE